MTAQAPPPAVRPPVALGCIAAAGAVALAVMAVVLAVIFLDSGADSGEAVLDPAASYAPGSVTRVADRGIYIVRLPDRALLALGDLDSANRAATDRRCRVAPVPAEDPSLPGLLAQYRSAFSAAATGTTLILREDCNGALYDPAGVRLDAEGPNLDRYSTSTNSEGRLVVSLGRRTCSRRDGATQYIPVECSK